MHLRDLVRDFAHSIVCTGLAVKLRSREPILCSAKVYLSIIIYVAAFTLIFHLLTSKGGQANRLLTREIWLDALRIPDCRRVV
jgi:hypothetical protein